jgi:ATP-dependent exoDNAse (exonuclease V) alpha subunit
MSTQKIKITDEFSRALDLMENTDKHIFLTGRAGTGKSTLLHLFREKSKKNLAVLAPTGVAAVNVKGQTIHSFFGFKPDITYEKVKRVDKGDELYGRLETLIIDEISMVRADLMDCVDKFLRLNGPYRDRPFGGVQMILIGDLYQLPPVVTGDERTIFASRYETPYFFSANAFAYDQADLFGKDMSLTCIELSEVFRQTDTEFIEILNAVRDNTIADHHLTRMNSRVVEKEKIKRGEMEMYLTTTNAEAAAINERELAKLSTDEFVFSAKTEGKFEARSMPTDADLAVKLGAQIMMLNNDPGGRWINGTVGQVERIEFDSEAATYCVYARLTDGELVKIFPHTWDMYAYHFDNLANHIESEQIGSFRQYPFRLAWAVTIHKAQGKTFDRVVLDLGRGTFSPGQLYVALSRCRTLEGLTLVRPVQRRHAFIDHRIEKFLQKVYTESRKP